ncbi:MAG: amidohydrolase family protein [Desulfobacterales bacterium]|nr:MAG: amidohydrolase family protein [Desulfobacterales bacterium]
MTDPVIVDTHVHFYGDHKQYLLSKATYEVWEYGPKENVCGSAYGGDPKDIIRAMDAAGASKAVMINLFAVSRLRDRAIDDLPEGLDGDQKEEAIREIEASMGERLKSTNKWCCDVAEKYPQLVPFIATDPWVLGVAEAQDHIREMVEQRGAKGIKVHQGLQRFYLHDERMLPICRLCIETDLPILAHSGPLRGAEQYAEPRAYAEALKIFPELRLVLAHLGGGAWRQTPEIAQAYPNVYFDCSEIIEWTGAPHAPTDREFAQLILDVGPERVMMASDFPWYDIGHAAERIMELPLLSKEQKESILGANAIRILKL